MAAAKAPAGQPEGPGADRRGRHAGSGAPGSGREARLGAGEELLRALPAVLAGAAGVWLGIQGLRLFLTMVVWNVAEDQPATRMALWALGLYLPGLLAWVPARLAGGARPAWRFGLLFGLLTALRPVRFGPVWTPALAFAAWIAWLWWWPAFLRELVRRRALGAAVPGILLGLMAQVAGQTALGGLDLPYLRSPGARGATVLLVGAFLLCLWQLHRGP
ncbi:MAG: hypothetical protein DIU70_004505, partial [Bacillota bacterium]